VVAYKVGWLESQVRHFLTVSTITLANLILGENAIPERLQWDCTPDKLAATLAPLIEEGPERRAQLAALARLDEAMRIGDEEPSERAARIVLSVAGR
jgi:lipid-A-disaccharide synthase